MWCSSGRFHRHHHRHHGHGHGHHDHGQGHGHGQDSHNNHDQDDDHRYDGHGQLDHVISGYDVMVSKNGRGNYTRVSEAIENAPNMSLTFYNIYIKEGTYEENLYIHRTKTNIRLFGDGAHRTIIFGNRTNNETNGPTIEIHGERFQAANMSFVNDAGLTAGQANAVRNVANNTIFYGCSIEGYQDTLYAVRGSQRYENCEIYGTVDFIYGNAAATFLDCEIYARHRGIVTYTAQGRERPIDRSGFLFQRCNFTMSPTDYGRKSDVKATFGRPWRAYSLVLIIESYIDSMVDRIGWLEFPDQPTDKLTYVEYGNVGPGSNTDGRVKWPGVKAFHHLPELLLFLSEDYPWISLSHNITWNLN
ncbi:hypothetical protein RIF29_17613 [Crotalaria pallida]|uniref:Pectinesterase catalytic domain-containing protein n=1 Tax=Crotalaria pallida TaxID=3830 RepID=A0AAN9ID47_CROPI